MRLPTLAVLLTLVCATPLSAQPAAVPHAHSSVGAVGYGGPGLHLGLEMSHRLVQRGVLRIAAEGGVLGRVAASPDVACLNAIGCRNPIPPRARALATIGIAATVGAVPGRRGWYAIGAVGAVAVRWDRAPVGADGRALQLATGFGREQGRGRLEFRLVRLYDGLSHVDGGRLSYSRTRSAR